MGWGGGGGGGSGSEANFSLCHTASDMECLPVQVSRPESLSKIDWSSFEKDPGIVVVEGSQRAGDQYHFYMETQSAIAFLTEEGGVKLYASTQSPTSIQDQVARVCDLPLNQVSVEVRELLNNCLYLVLVHTWYSMLRASWESSCITLFR